MTNLNSIEHNELFDLAYRFVTETNENIFLTGKAGTGKTTFLKYLKENCSKNIVVAAPTGVAAINAGGVTLHSLFQLPFNPFLPTKSQKDELLAKIRFNKQRQQLLRKMELLIIDEISMVRCDTMDAIDTILRWVRKNYDAPFGGVQVLCIGDLHQLPPVAQRHEWDILQEYYSSPFFFDCKVIKERMPLLIELDKVYRQKEDSFIALLNKVRNNQMKQEDFDDLHLRYDPGFHPPLHENYITLTSHNNQADIINNRELQKIPTPSFIYEAIIEDDFSQNIFPAESSLVLKVGAQVMFLKNDVIQKRYFNGKIGVIKSLDEDDIVVECDGTAIPVLPETWENTRYVVNRADGKLEQQTVGSFTQFPLRLAWAITIHKSQGLTFDKVTIDAGEAFSSGQVYVALSRCTSLAGIVLLSKIPPAAIHSNDNVIKGQQLLTSKDSLADRFTNARQSFTKLLLEDIFSFNAAASQVESLHSRIIENQNKLNNQGATWIADLKNELNSQKQVGLKFLKKVEDIMKEQPVAEQNELLQKRIGDAANHFQPKFAMLKQHLQTHPLVTEHRETASVIDEQLLQLLLTLHLTDHFLQFCKQGFRVTSFLQHKLKYSQPRFNITCYATRSNQALTDIPNPALFSDLKHWRNKVCEESGLPIYMVANQATLTEIALYLPRSKDELAKLRGFGKVKVDKYGDEILDYVANYCSAHNIESNMSAKAASPKRQHKESMGIKTDTKTISYNLFKEGRSVADIAKERNLSTSTIESHLIPFVKTGEIDLEKLVTLQKQLLIRAAVITHGQSSLKLLIENLPADITYGDIKLVLAQNGVSENTHNSI